jgi:uncharacterized delta-60 repeat protein
MMGGWRVFAALSLTACSLQNQNIYRNRSGTDSISTPKLRTISNMYKPRANFDLPEQFNSRAECQVKAAAGTESPWFACQSPLEPITWAGTSLERNFKGVLRVKGFNDRNEASEVAEVDFENVANLPRGFDDTPRAIAPIEESSDTNWWVGGAFKTKKLVGLQRAIRLTKDGEIDHSFAIAGTGFNSVGPEHVVSTSNQKYIVAGRFDQYDGQQISKGLARLNVDGSLDRSFNSGGLGFERREGANISIGMARKMFLLAGNAMIVVGDFTHYNGVTRPGIAKIDENGQLDSSYQPAIPANYFTSDGAAFDGQRLVLVIGGPPSVSETTGFPWEWRVLRLTANGAIDPGFVVAPMGSNQRVECIAFDEDETILLGGSFTSGPAIRLNANGSVSSLNPFDQGLVGTAYQIKIVSGGYLVMGNWQRSSPVMFWPSPVVRLNSNGSFDSIYRNFSTSPNESQYIANPSFDSRFDVLADGRLLVSNARVNDDVSNFDIPSIGIARLTSAGLPDATFASTVKNYLRTYGFAVDSQGRILLIGTFRYYATAESDGLEQLDSRGEIVDIALPRIKMQSGSNTGISTLLPLGLKKTLVAGDFDRVNDAPSAGAFVISESGDVVNANPFDQAPLTPGSRRIVTSQSYRDRRFLSYQQSTTGVVVERFLPNFSLDPTFEPIQLSPAPIYSVQLGPNQEILISGDFTSVNGVSRVAKLLRFNPNGSFSESIAVASTEVPPFTVLNDGSVLLATGRRDLSPGVSTMGLRLHRNGTGFDTNVDAQTQTGFATPSSYGFVARLLALDDGGFLALGGFSQFNSNIGFANVARFSRDMVAQPFSTVTQPSPSSEMSLQTIHNSKKFVNFNSASSGAFDDKRLGAGLSVYNIDGSPYEFFAGDGQSNER